MSLLTLHVNLNADDDDDDDDDDEGFKSINFDNKFVFMMLWPLQTFPFS